MLLNNAKKTTLTILMLVMAVMLMNPAPAAGGSQGANCGSMCYNSAGCGSVGTCQCLSSGCNCQPTTGRICT